MNRTTIFAAAIDGKVDRAAGRIMGVSVMTTGVARGHNLLIDDVTLSQVRGLMATMGTVKVKVDHWSGFTGIVGALSTPRIDGDRVRADFDLIQSHDMFDVILEMAEKQPNTFGFSIAFSGIPEEKDKLLYARVTELYSVDLVDQPAANPDGLFNVDSNPQTRNVMLEEIKQLLGLASKAEANLTTLSASIAKITSLEEANRKLTTDLATVTADSARLNTELGTATVKINALQAEVDALPEKIKTEGAKLAVTIAAAQGIPPVPAGSNPPQPGGEDIVAQLAKITDPMKRTEFYRKNKAAVDAQFK